MSIQSERVLVTGGTGFLGRHLISELEAAGYENVFAPRSSEYDLRDPVACERLLADTKPDVVIHLAAVVGGIGANAANPATYFHDNAIMGIQLIERARRAGVRKMVILGTVCSYPKITPTPFHEDDLWNGYPEETNAPYGLAKKLLLIQAQAYRKQYGFNAIYLVPVNLYGPADNFDPDSSHVIPALIRRFSEAKRAGLAEVTCWGTGTPTREFLFVTDAARAIRLAAERYDDPDPVNIGSGDEYSIADVAKMVADDVGYTGAISWDASKPDGQPRRKLDTSRAAERFGFRAQVEMPEGLRRTVDWYERHVIRATAPTEPVLPS